VCVCGGGGGGGGGGVAGKGLRTFSKCFLNGIYQESIIQKPSFMVNITIISEYKNQ
jgi:hypothetical protein